MTDITELAQKRSAAISRLRGAFEPGHTNQREVDALSYAVDVMNELVEALEKAQPAQPCEHSMFWDASGVRRCSKCDIPEHANVHYADAAEMEIAALRQRIAELESRTVKLPKRSVGEVMHMSGFSRDYAEGWCSGNDNAIHEMRVAGIKWEDE